MELEANQQTESTTESKTLDRKKAAQYCGVSVVTIDRALAKNKIGHFRIGRRVLFSTAHLDSFLKRNEVSAK
jgi:excisionase family DNA binding protein